MTALLFLSLGLAEAAETRDDRPNIVLIMADDMGYSDLGCYGSEIETPALDRLAASGLRFSQFYNTARCCPTRASLLTGLYPAQTGVGFMTGDGGLPGYRGELNEQCVTIAEVLAPSGYRAYLSGKWHVARNLKDIEGQKYNWPLQRGFQKFFGTIIGAGSHWDPWTLTRGNAFITPFNDPEYQPSEKWHYTDAISDNAVKFIDEHETETPGQPFFMYVSYTAPHWPMHAREEDIARYAGKYDAGYRAIREQRYRRLIELGLIDQDWPLSEQAGEWESVENKRWHTRNMEVYAAMITQMDRGIGRIVEALEEAGRLDNTLILFLQDNGGCAETLGGHKSRSAYKEIPPEPVYEPMGPDELQTRMVPQQTRDGFPVVVMSEEVLAGSDRTYHAYGEAWANVSNTPFRQYKHWVHEGGVATPLVAHWPAGIRDAGAIRRQPSHLIDIMATVVELGEAAYPSKGDDGRAIHPMQGASLVGVMTEDAPLERDTIYFEHEGNRAIRRGQWKLVSRAMPRAGHFRREDQIALDEWELYDLKANRTETRDLAAHHPDLVEELAADWQRWAEATNTVPKPK